VHKADNLPPSCAVVTKYGNRKFLEPTGPVQGCNGTTLPLHFTYRTMSAVQNMAVIYSSLMSCFPGYVFQVLSE